MTTAEAKAGFVSFATKLSTIVGAIVLIGGLAVGGVAWFLGVETKENNQTQHQAIRQEISDTAKATRAERQEEIKATKDDFKQAMKEQTDLLRDDLKEIRQRVDQVYRTVK